MHHPFRVGLLQQAPDQNGRRLLCVRGIWYVAIALALAACSGVPQAAVLTVEPTPTGTPAPTPTHVVATTWPATPSPTPIPPTPAPPTATVESTATASPFPTASVTPTTVQVRPSPTLPTLDQEARARLFDAVWQTVADKYLYGDFHGVDWQTIRERYRPRALDAPDAEHFYATIKQIVGLLDDRHSRFLSPQEAFQERARTSGTDVRVGIGVALRGDRIETVYRGSPAEETGLRRRDRILAVDGQPFTGQIAALRGEAGTTMTLKVQAPGEEPRTVAVERRPVVQKIQIEAYRLPGTNIGYLSIQSFWAEDMGEQVVAALTELLHAGPIDGLIVDLRGNGGGWRPVLQQLLGSFVAGEVGEFYRQEQSHPLEGQPTEVQQRLASTPIVFLVDEGTQSYAEVLPAALQAAGRAKIVGERTVGNTETIFAYDFEDGSRLWLAGEGFRLPSGVNLEGHGVIPDVEIDVDWRSFAEAEDPHIEKALELLRAAGG